MDRSVFKNKPFLFILFTGFLAVLGIGLIIPVIPFIIAKYVGENNNGAIAFYVGLLTALYSLCQFFAAPVLGALSDRYGRRPILLLCLLGSAIGYILFGIGGSLTILFIGRIIDGLTGGDIATAMAYIADVTEPHERGKYFGVVGAMVGFGFILGPSVGGLVSHISLSAPLYLAAGLTLLNMLYGYFILPESLAKKHRTADFSLHHLNPFTQLRYIFENPFLKSLMLIGFFYFFAFAQLQAISSVFFKDVLGWNPGNIGLYFLVLGVGDMFTQGYLSGKLLTKFGAAKLVSAGFLLTALAYSVNAILPVFQMVFLAYVYIIIYALGSGLFEPSFGGLVSGSVGPKEQGRVQGASQSMQSITRIIGPIFAAFLYQFSPSLPWVTCVILSLIGVVMLTRKQKDIAQHLSAQAVHAS
jgi:DHA1 family tetracycline resistance protein-like MFS transporter